MSFELTRNDGLVLRKKVIKDLQEIGCPKKLRREIYKRMLIHEKIKFQRAVINFLLLFRS